MKKGFIKSSIVTAFLLGSVGLSGCGLLGSMTGSVFPNEKSEYNEYSTEETIAKQSSEEVSELLQDETLQDLLVERIDQNVLKYRNYVYITNHNISEYQLYIVSDSNEKIAKEIRNTYKVFEQYLQSDAYKGEAVSITIMTDSIHCHAANYIAAIENVDYSYNYNGKKETYTVADHISYIEPHGIDEESEIYDKNVEYIINQEDFWKTFDADCVIFDYFLL